VGSTNRRADLVLIEEMRRFSQVSSLDEQPMPELNSEAIDFRAASEFFRPIRKLTRHELETLKLVTTYQGRIVPTIGGVLLFGADRLRHYPDAWIQAGRFAGNDRRRIMDTTEVRSYLPSAVEEVIAFLQKHMTREAVIGSVKRTDVWTYPVVAVREAIMNAIVHADYAQRARRFVLPSSMIALRSRILDCSRSASPSKIFKEASQNSATESSAEYFRNSD